MCAVQGTPFTDAELVIAHRKYVARTFDAKQCVWVPTSGVVEFFVHDAEMAVVVYLEPQNKRGVHCIVHPASAPWIHHFIAESRAPPQTSLTDALGALVSELRYHPDAGREARARIDAYSAAGDWP